jgi:hypothetical protein
VHAKPSLGLRLADASDNPSHSLSPLQETNHRVLHTIDIACSS